MLKIFITSEPIDFNFRETSLSYRDGFRLFFYHFEYRFSKGYGRTEKIAYNLTKIMSVQQLARFFVTEKKGFRGLYIS